MDEKTNVQDEVFDMNNIDMADFDAEDEAFDMADFDAEDEAFDMNEAEKDQVEQQQKDKEEMDQINKQSEKMAAKFPDDFVLIPPEDTNKYISETLAKKARKRA